MKILITKATKQPEETADIWSFDLNEIDHIFEANNEDVELLYWDGRLYEVEA